MGLPVASASEHHLLENYLAMQENSTETYYKGFLDFRMDFHIMDIFDNFFEDESNIDILTFTNEEKMEYKYNPIQLCIDLYSTHDFWQIILELNDMSHEGEFDLVSPIKVPKEEAFIAFINYIYSLKNKSLTNKNKFSK